MDVRKADAAYCASWSALQHVIKLK